MNEQDTLVMRWETVPAYVDSMNEQDTSVIRWETVPAYVDTGRVHVSFSHDADRWLVDHWMRERDGWSGSGAPLPLPLILLFLYAFTQKRSTN